MDKNQISLDIGNFLGFCEKTGVEALTDDMIDDLKSMIKSCQEAAAVGDELVSNSIYDRLMDILSTVEPDSELIGHIWEDDFDNGGTDFDESDELFLNNPMYSIQTAKSFGCQELADFAKRLPSGSINLHASLKENGWGIRIVYKHGVHYKSRTRARASEGRDITPQMRVILGDFNEIEALKDLPYCEIRGEVVCSYDGYEQAKNYKSDVRSPFTAVSTLIKESATEEQWGILNFIAYRFIADGVEFSTKTQEYEYLENELGFEVPLYLQIEDVDTDTIVRELEDSIIPDMESMCEDYEYYTDGVVIEVDSRDLARSLGQGSGNYNNYNIAMKVGNWKQDLNVGYVQTILWMRGKSKLSPVAIVAEDENVIEFTDGQEHMYVMDVKDITNYSELGVATQSGNKVRRIPLYEPCNILSLDAYRGSQLSFRYGGEAGVVPCFPDGTPLIDGRVKESVSNGSITYEEYEDYNYEG